MSSSMIRLENSRRARDFAIAAHGEQRYGDHPYVFHLDAVAALLAPYGVDAQTIGYLHDVVPGAGEPDWATGAVENLFATRGVWKRIRESAGNFGMFWLGVGL